MDIFLGSAQNWTGFRSNFFAFLALFLKTMYRMGIFFGVAKISNIVLGMPDKPTYEEKNERTRSLWGLVVILSTGLAVTHSNCSVRLY